MQQELDATDLKRISDLIYEKYNYDFRNYAISSFRRRIARILELKKLTLGHLLSMLNDTPVFINEFINEVTVNVTEMFRDPAFWKVIRDDVLPSIMSQRKRIAIWHAGCSSGEEVIAMSILLHELGIEDKVLIVATDLDHDMIANARTATYPMKSMDVNEKNYQLFSESSSGLDHYYERHGSKAVFNPDLLKHITFRRHDLVTGEVFGKFDLILCRNVMIYFNQALQNHVLMKFHESLLPNGYLCVGSKESLIWCDYANRFQIESNDEKIYRKITE